MFHEDSKYSLYFIEINQLFHYEIQLVYKEIPQPTTLSFLFFFLNYEVHFISSTATHANDMRFFPINFVTQD